MDYPTVPVPDAPPIESGFEPQTRARSNTWPLPRPEEPCFPHSSQPPLPENNELTTQSILGFPAKKSTSRRNAWGNLSYADLITQAIQSSPDSRLTLSQIYDWMVTNVSYFKDKGDSNSSAGWKNSIRHNLSLHNRFMRVQNEGTGKSSWWMLNPDAKPGKAARRRATSMETSKFEKKRGRIKKKLEAMRNGGILDTPSPASSLSEGLDLFPESPQIHNFNLSPSDFRPRASSNASSCGGRLSPIMSETVDLHDNQIPPLAPWETYNYAHYVNQNVTADRFGTDQLAASLGNTMKLQEPVQPVGSYDFHGQFRQSPNFSGGASIAQSGGFPQGAAAIPNTRNDQVQTDSQLLNGIYGSTYSNSAGTNSFLLPQQDIKPLLSNEQHSDLDFNLEQLEANPFDCNVEEVLQTELNLGGEIDFNFGVPTTLNNHLQPNNVTAAPPTTNSLASPNPPFTSSVVTHHHHQQTNTGRQWVH